MWRRTRELHDFSSQIAFEAEGCHDLRESLDLINQLTSVRQK